MPLPAVVRAHTVARAVFGIDRMWDAVRPLDNQVSAAVQVELRTEATRLAERAARWLLRLPSLAAEPAAPIARGHRPVRGRGGRRAGRVCPSWLLGDRGRRLRRAGCPAAGRRGARGAGRRGGGRPAAAGRARSGRRRRAHRRTDRARRAGHAVPGRAAGSGAAARAGHRAAARPPLAVDGPRLACATTSPPSRPRSPPTSSACAAGRTTGRPTWSRPGRTAGTAPSSAPPPSWPTSTRGTGTSWPSCWSPSAPCAASAASR